jgi:argininosuccinate lyase
VDYELLRFDVAGSIAHARGLRAAGLLTAAQLGALERGLLKVLKEASGPAFEIKASDEDVHTLVERRLTEIAPDVGRRLHAGRSRNDQVALDLRLWCREAASELVDRTAALAAALAQQALRHADWPMPGYTHLQRAQPVTVGHHLLAHAEPLLRDAERARHAYESADALPLGAGALAGSTLPLQREVVKHELGFSRLLDNSIDAVSDRDFALDLAYACVALGVHLSRLGEDVVLWATSEFGYLRLADEVATGSSLMPQKKNPDIAELLRGRTGRALGAFTALATVLKGLPLAYDRDLQEDKVALFGAVENALACLGAARLLVERLEFDHLRLEAAASDASLLATDSAEKLVTEGTPFRDAHREVGEKVRAGTHQPPWGVRESLRRRELNVNRQVRSVERRAVALSKWAEVHPPSLLPARRGG